MDSIMAILESVMGARDPYTVVHQQRVTQISLAIGEEMGLEQKVLANLEIASRMHDLGKISVPMAILSKTATLSFSETSMVRRHPIEGINILNAFNYPVSTFLPILQHHERLDGSGYPFGLSGDDILLEARILAVADVVDAISFPRPYRPSLGIEKALNELCQNKGTLYDQSVVEAFDNLYANKKFHELFAFEEIREAA
jgi:putative two-component system response regulator